MSENKREPTPSPSEEKKSPGFFSLLQSVLAAMIGVQSEEKRKQDFEGGHPGSYIFIGVVMVIIFIFVLIAIVNNILESA